MIPFHQIALDFFDYVDLAKIYQKSMLDLTLDDLFDLPSSFLGDYVISQLDNHVIDKFDVIGISITVTRQLYSALLIAQFVRQHYPNKLIVLGGSAISSLFEQITYSTKFFDFFDYVVKSDGCIPLMEILNDYPKNKIHSIAYRENNQVFFNNLSKLPDDLYFYTPYYQSKYLENYPKPLLLGVPTHVGCYYAKCAFCDYGTVGAYKYNHCGTTPLINTIETLLDKFNVNGFYFTGAGMHPKDFKALAQSINHRQLNIKWSAESLAVKFPYESALEIKKSGCINLDFGLESASPVIRDFLNKGIKVETFRETLKTFREVDFKSTTVNLILTYPIGTQQELDETLTFLSEYQDVIFHAHQSSKLDLRGYNEYYYTLHNYTDNVVSGRSNTLIRDFPYPTDENLLNYWLEKFKHLAISGHFDWKRCADVSLIDHALYVSHNSSVTWANIV